MKLPKYLTNPTKRPKRPPQEISFAGYNIAISPKGNLHVDRGHLTAHIPGEDYGSDPLGDGKFRMVPSGDIVDYEEMKRRLHRFRPSGPGW